MPEFFKKEFSRDLVMDYLDYDPSSGLLTWKKKASCRSYVGDIAGRNVTHKTGKTYTVIQFCKKKFLAHRLIWFYMTGSMPDQIDHIDGNGVNNKWCNLRSVTKKENSKNLKIGKKNKSGVIGVRIVKNKFVAQIGVNGGVIYLGTFDNIGCAAAARKAAERMYSFHECHGNFKSIN